MRRNWKLFLAGALAALALRLAFVFFLPLVVNDSLVYADIANNWLRHGVYGMTEDGTAAPTLIRLPGYPGFLALVFALFGSKTMLPVMLAQTAVDLGTCFLIAALAREIAGERAAPIAFLLAALCPFTANYVALPLTETLAIFFSALALFAAIKCLNCRPGWPLKWCAACGAAIGAGLLIRPDGGLLLAAIGLALAWRVRHPAERKPAIAAGMVIVLVALAPLVPWTARNWRVFHQFQPLAPRYANAPSEFVPMGFNRWMKTWAADYTAVEDVYWKVSSEAPGEAVAFDSIPARAFDSTQQRERAAQLFSEYNQTLMLTPQADAGFAELAAERIHAAPLRYYVWLPALRIASMWFRPRTEMLPLERDWWKFTEPRDSFISAALGLLNLLLLGAAVAGAFRLRHAPNIGFLVGFVLLRSLFLGTLENPEPRYMLECFPVALALAADAVQALFLRRHQQASATTLVPSRSARL